MKNKKTLNGTQKLVFVPKKPVKKDLVMPEKDIKEVVASKKSFESKNKQKIVKKELNRNNLLINNEQHNFLNKFAAKNEYKGKEYVEYVKNEENEDYIDQDELIHDYKNEVKYGFTNESLCLINGIIDGEIFCDKNGEIYYEENGNIYDFVCNESEKMNVVQIGEDAYDFGTIRTCYTMIRRI